MREFILMILGVFILSGCADRIRENINYVLGNSAKQEAGISEPRYCYRSIGTINSYSEPLKGQEANRLVGHEGPAPRSTSGTGPLRP